MSKFRFFKIPKLRMFLFVYCCAVFHWLKQNVNNDGPWNNWLRRSHLFTFENNFSQPWYFSSAELAELQLVCVVLHTLFAVFLIVAIWRVSGGLGLYCGGKNILGRVVFQLFGRKFLGNYIRLHFFLQFLVGLEKIVT